MSWGNYGRFGEYVPVAERKANIAKKIDNLKKKKKDLLPIVVEGRTLTKTYWGKSWINNIESYADYAYRLDRGRSYVRHGAVIDLKIYPGLVEAIVCGTRDYTIKITIDAATPTLWARLIDECSGKISSLVELLQGKLSEHIMTIIAQANNGLFPKPKEIKFQCSCPDYAYMCKHIAAVLYGIGIRLDSSPELLFQLRQVDQADLIDKATENISLATITTPHLDTIDGDLSNIFGVEISSEPKIAKKAIKKALKKTIKTASTSKSPKNKRSKIKKKVSKNSSLKK